MIRTLHVSDRFSVHHQESSTVYTAIRGRYMSYSFGTGLVVLLVGYTVYNTRLLMIGQKTCPKHVQFYSKNKFE